MWRLVRSLRCGALGWDGVERFLAPNSHSLYLFVGSLKILCRALYFVGP